MIKGASLYALEEEEAIEGGGTGCFARRRIKRMRRTESSGREISWKLFARDFSSKSDARRARAQFATDLPSLLPVRGDGTKAESASCVRGLIRIEFSDDPRPAKTPPFPPHIPRERLIVVSKLLYENKDA